MDLNNQSKPTSTSKEPSSPRMKSPVRSNILSLTMIAMFTALIAVCTLVTIPMPPPFVPFTLQTLAVFLAGSFLGMKRGIVSVLVYILLGMVGVPVFAQFKSGISALMGPTGGFIIGFIATAAIVGFFQDRFGNRLWSLVLSMSLGLIACYAFGTIWFVVVYQQSKGSMDIWNALSICVFPFLLFDAVKILAAVLLSYRLHKLIKT